MPFAKAYPCNIILTCDIFVLCIMLTIEQLDCQPLFVTEQYGAGELFLRAHGYSQSRTGRIVPSPLINFSTFCV